MVKLSWPLYTLNLYQFLLFWTHLVENKTVCLYFLLISGKNKKKTFVKLEYFRQNWSFWVHLKWQKKTSRAPVSCWMIFFFLQKKVSIWFFQSSVRVTRRWCDNIIAVITHEEENVCVFECVRERDRQNKAELKDDKKNGG